MAISRESIQSDVVALPLPTLTLASYGGKGIGVRTLTYLGARTRIMSLKGRCGGDAKTNDASLQIDSDLFLESSSSIDDYLNHSCIPNSSIDWSSLFLSTSREVLPGEEITIDYNMGEFDMTALQKDHSFGCQCQSADCIKVVKGFKHLTVEQKLARRKSLSPYLQKMLWLELGDLRGGPLIGCALISCAANRISCETLGEAPWASPTSPPHRSWRVMQGHSEVRGDAGSYSPGRSYRKYYRT